MKRPAFATLLATLLALILVHGPLAAAPLKEPSTGVRFQTPRSAGGRSFRCLGTGLRKVLFFKVYANTFCLEEAKADAILKAAREANGKGKHGEDLADELEESNAYFEALASADADKLVVMHMVRDVSREKLAGAFQDSLEKILPQASIDRLKGAMRADAKEGQEVLFYTHGSKVTIDLGGERVEIDDAKIAKKIWSVWLGPGSVTPTLREDIARRQAGASE